MPRGLAPAFRITPSGVCFAGAGGQAAAGPGFADAHLVAALGEGAGGFVREAAFEGETAGVGGARVKR